MGRDYLRVIDLRTSRRLFKVRGEEKTVRTSKALI